MVYPRRADIVIARRIISEIDVTNTTVVGVDPSTGSLLWERGLRDFDVGPVVDGAAYISVDGVIRRVDPTTGYAVGPSIRRPGLDRALALADGHLYVSLRIGSRRSVGSVDVDSGALEWRRRVPGFRHLSVAAGGGTVVLSRGATLDHPAFTKALRAADGDVLWASDRHGGAVVGAAGVFYVRRRSVDRTIALRGADGEVLRRLPGVHRVVIADGVVVATLEETIEIWA